VPFRNESVYFINKSISTSPGFTEWGILQRPRHMTRMPEKLGTAVIPFLQDKKRCEDHIQVQDRAWFPESTVLYGNMGV
jgi:hypothetical protein